MSNNIKKELLSLMQKAVKLEEMKLLAIARLFCISLKDLKN
jgi:hypothetical protein